MLRYLVTHGEPVAPERLIVGIEWSDLPKTSMQARKALDVLRRFGLVERVDKNQYTATEAGKEVIRIASGEKLWQQAPDLSVTNVFLHRDEKKGKGKQ